MADEYAPSEVDAALETNATCANCGRDFRAHCFERGADCGMYTPVIETTGEIVEPATDADSQS